ncbi:MAG: tRNA-dihydrouridine synthase [Arcobacteraceae bacterium]|jgi:tRNA-dihydrouridine synthase B|nr:tRNA-dihydrouridine synthase [Arcobacteraceae bacterium]
MSQHILDFSRPLVVLAPLAGYTDLPFRTVAKKFGVDLTISEMISSNALAYANEKTLKMVEKAHNENPYIVQISGSKIEMIRMAVEKLNEIDGIDGIDLNCGCPAPKVFHHGSGSNLLGDLPRLQAILGTIKKYSNKKYTTAKVRIGVTEKIPYDIARAVEDAGADMISVHGRTKAGGYKSEVDYDAIKVIKDAVSVPVIANGDITSYQKAKDVLAYTGANGVMIGRGAVGNPWIFHQIATGEEFVSSALKKEIIKEHYESMIAHYGYHGMIMFRKHLHTYSKGIDGASEFRQKVNYIIEINEMREIIESFFPEFD